MSATDAALAAEDLTFGYPKHPPLFSDLSLAFAPGTSTAITGASGRGKSTLMYILGLMLSPTGGSVRVLGEATHRMSDRDRSRLRAHAFGFVFQDAALDSTRTVFDNLTETLLYRAESRAGARVRERAAELLARFEVRVPLDRRPAQVSGGQAQRIALCRALFNSPPLLLADEPTGNLDPVSAEIVVRALLDYAAAGNTVVIVTHSPEIAARCTREVRL